MLLVLCGGSSVLFATAAQAGYGFDKPYYHPGDTGYFYVNFANNQQSPVSITRATLNITGIGAFNWDSSTVEASDLQSAAITEMPNFDENGNSYANVNGCRIDKGGSAVFKIYFKISESAVKGDYRYDFYMPVMVDIPVQVTGIVNVYPVGETPQPGRFSGLFIVGLLSTLVTLPLFLVMRWQKAKAAKFAKLCVVASVLVVVVALLLSFLLP